MKEIISSFTSVAMALMRGDIGKSYEYSLKLEESLADYILSGDDTEESRKYIGEHVHEDVRSLADASRDR